MKQCTQLTIDVCLLNLMRARVIISQHFCQYDSKSQHCIQSLPYTTNKQILWQKNNNKNRSSAFGFNISTVFFWKGYDIRIVVKHFTFLFCTYSKKGIIELSWDLLFVTSASHVVQMNPISRKTVVHGGQVDFCIRETKVVFTRDFVT